MPEINEQQSVVISEFLRETFPASLSNENQLAAKREYEGYVNKAGFPKNLDMKNINPFTVYLVIKDLKGQAQVEFIRDNIEYLSKNDENVFIYSMMGPPCLASFLSYDSIKEIYKHDKKIFVKLLCGNSEGLFNGFSNEELLAFYRDYREEINETVDSTKFNALMSYAWSRIFKNARGDRSVLGLGNDFFNDVEKEQGRLMASLLELYKDKINSFSDSYFLDHFHQCASLCAKETSFLKFFNENKERLDMIYKEAQTGRLWDSFSEMGIKPQQFIFANFGDTLTGREDFSELCSAIRTSILCDLYKKDKGMFKNVEPITWLKTIEDGKLVKDILDELEIDDLEELFEYKSYLNKELLKYVEIKYRNNIRCDGKIGEISESTSIFSDVYLKNLKEIKIMIDDGIIVKNDAVYKDHLKLFVNYLKKKQVVGEYSRESIQEIEKYFYSFVKGESLTQLKVVDNFNEMVLFNRVGNVRFMDSSKFNVDQIKRFNVKELRELVKNRGNGQDCDYRTLCLKLIFLVGYERAKKILDLDDKITTLEHLVGNVDVRNVKLDQFGDPILNEKIINLLFKDLYRNRIKLMLENKDNDLYKYFPRIFNEWDIIKQNGKDKNLKTILEFLKSDEVCVDVKHYRLKGLFKYIGCRQEIVEEALKVHDLMLDRKESTIPRVYGQKDGYTYEILKLHDMEGLTVGNRTDCCFTVRGVGYSSLKHGVLSKDGRILVIRKDGQLVAHSWLWRNGNVLCLDNIEVSKSIKEVDFLDVYLQFAKQIVEKSFRCEGNDKCIKNVTLGRNTMDVSVVGLERFKKLSNVLDGGSGAVEIKKLPKVNEEKIYSDATKAQVILIGNGDFEYYDASFNYRDERKEVLSYFNDKKDTSHINDIINCLRYLKYEKCGKVDEFKIIDVEDYKCAWCNEDWFILIDNKGNVEKYAVLEDDEVKQEMDDVLNNQIKKVVKR